MALVIDTGPLVASLNARDPDHERCRELLAGAAEARVIPAPVLVEVAHFAAPGIRALLGDIARGAYEVADLRPAEWSRVDELMATYADMPVDLVDAAVVTVTERLGERRVATLDRRRFAVVRPRHVEALELLPG